MKKGVILSMDKHFLTLLTPEGEFHRSKKQEDIYEVGKEIYFSPYDVKKSKASLRFLNTRPALVAAIISILLIISLLPSYFNEKVYAYVTIDINPSIELSLNENLNVVDLYGINKEGILVLEKIKDWENTDVFTMTNRIVKATKESGYANHKHQILVSATILKNNQVLTKKLDEKLKEISKQQVVPEAEVKIIKATVNERSKAKKQGISTGKYIENKREKELQNKEQDREKSVPVEEHSPNIIKKPAVPLQKVNRILVEQKGDTKKVIQESKTPAVKAKSMDVIKAKKAAPVEKRKEEKNEKKIEKQELKQQTKKNNPQSTEYGQKLSNQKKKENQQSTESGYKKEHIEWNQPNRQESQKNNQKKKESQPSTSESGYKKIHIERKQPNRQESQKNNQREEKQRQIENQKSRDYIQKNKNKNNDHKQIQGEQNRNKKEPGNRGYPMHGH